MKQLSLCPKCSRPLHNVAKSERYKGQLREIWVQSCNKNPSHSIQTVAAADEIISINIAIDLTWNVRAVWHLDSKTLEIIHFNLGLASTKLPFFEPDLTNYDGLISKVKTYLTFL